MVSDSMRDCLKEYDDGRISGLELREKLEGHLSLRPEEFDEVLGTLEDAEDHHLQFVGTLIRKSRSVDHSKQKISGQVAT